MGTEGADAAGMKLKGFSSSSYELEEEREVMVVLFPGLEVREEFWVCEGD